MPVLRPRHLIGRGLLYYWRTHVAVVLGVATAVAVLAGALLVGDSVRGSLRDLVLQRMGRTDLAVVSDGFFREALADELARQPSFRDLFSGACPLVILDGFVTDQASGRRAHQVRVYGVDERFWRFHGVEAGMAGDREALVGGPLAERLGVRSGGSILVRVQRPSDIPLESLNGRKDDTGRTLRLDVREVLPSARLGEFSLEPGQGDVRAVFVPLARLQQELDLRGRVNTLLVSSLPGRTADSVPALGGLIRSEADLEDVGLTVRALEDHAAVVVNSDAGLLTDGEAAITRQTLVASGMAMQPSFTYLANAIRVGDRAVPYSLVTAIDLSVITANASADRSQNPASTVAPTPPIVLNDWAASDLRARVGDMVSLDYYVWEDPGRLATRSADFRVAAIVPVSAADRDFAPRLPGISDSPTLSDWNPPFPVDLRRIRPPDEAYWDRYRTTPKAFIALDVGQQLWRSRYGALTSIRVRLPAGAGRSGEQPIGQIAAGVAAGGGAPDTAAGGGTSAAAPTAVTALREKVAQGLRASVDPLSLGLGIRQVRSDGLAVSNGATDFGEYFTYFSFFLVVSALVLAALFFKLGVEQRVREVGLLRAVGFETRTVRRLFLSEGIVLAILGSALGTAGAIGYASLLTTALRTWWVDAVGTTAITLHVTRSSLLAGAAGGIVAAIICIWWTLRGLARVSERSLLSGQLGMDAAGTTSGPRSSRRLTVAAGVLCVTGLALLVSAAFGVIDGTGAFFGAGSGLLGAALCLFAVVLRLPPRNPLAGGGWWPLSRLGLRNLSFRPGRSVLAVAVIASATFIIIAVDAFRRDHSGAVNDPHSGTGGYALIAESLVPVVHDPNTPEGRETLNLSALDAAVRFEPFRVLPGDDTSCLNLYEPRNPRIMAPSDAFLAAGRFAFQDSLAATEEQRANPWLLLRGQTESDPIAHTGGQTQSDPVPAIADANSLTYVLHRKLGDELSIDHAGRKLSLRIVGVLRDSIFQGELLISQTNFRALFPEQDGYQFFLVDAPEAGVADARDGIEDALGDLGAEVTRTADRLAEFHKVENTYLSTFQTLGGLGLLLGTLGLSTVVLRNMLERRRELALLAAVGYRRQDFLLMTLAENAAILAVGLAIGAVCAGLAVAPAVAERGGRLPLTSAGALLLFAVFLTGLLSSVVALRAATRSPLLASLRSE